MRRLQIALLVLLAGTAAAQAASLVVVEARGIALRPGATLDSTKVLQLKQGQHVTLISDTGSVLKIDGPYNALPLASGGGGVDLNQTLRALVSQRETRGGEYGTTRGTVLSKLPEPWLLDASHSGTGCLLENRTPMFWRPDDKAAAKLTVTPVDRSWKAVATWPAGQGRIAITTDVPMQGGETYIVVLNDEEFAISMTLLPATLTNDQMRAAWMAEKGCEAQAEALSKTDKMKLPALVLPARGKSWKRGTEMLVASLLCGLVIWAAIENFSFLSRLNQLVQDWETASVFAPHMEQDPDILIVAIDEETLQGLKYRSPVDRKFLSDLLQAIAAHSPKVIGLDILLDQPTEADKDAALHQTLSRLKVPLIASYVALNGTESPEQLAFEDAMLPVRSRGLADLPRDQFDTARSIFPGAKVKGQGFVPGFARAIAAAAGKQSPAEQTFIVWRGKPARTELDHDPKRFRQLSATVAGVMPDNWFRNKIVLIGSDVTMVDRHRTPFSILPDADATGPEKDGQLAGVVIQAHSVSQLLHGLQSPLVSWPVDLAITFLFTLVGSGLGGSNGALWLRVATLFWIAALFWAVALAVYHYQDIMIGMVAPPVAMATGFAALDSLGGRAARRQRKFIQDAMARYVSPKLVEQMVEDPERLSLQGERRLMTYLFSDIENFTTLSEKMDSADLAVMLNAYLDGMTDIVLKHDGMVDKFIGDAVFAIFNAPLDLADHAQKAVECMLAMDRFTETFRKAQRDLGFPLGVTRIGVHTGVAVVGNFGSQARFTYTAQGDAVNTASRLEGINKYFGTRLCVSDATRLLCHDIAFRPLASVVLKGKTEAIDLWEPLQEGATHPDFLAAYDAAFDRLKAGDPDAASLFAALAAEHPEDPCVRLHVERLKHGATDAKMVMTEK